MLLSGPFPPLKAAYQSQFTVYELFLRRSGGLWGKPEGRGDLPGPVWPQGFCRHGLLLYTLMLWGKEELFTSSVWISGKAFNESPHNALRKVGSCEELLYS